MPELILFATGLAALQIIPVFLHHSDEKEAIQIEEAFLISMFLLMNVVTVIAAMMLATTVSNAVNGKAWYKLVYNVVTQTVAVGISALIAKQIGTPIGAVVGAIAYTVLTAVGIAILFKRLKVDYNLDISTRAVLLGTALGLGIVMYSQPMYMPFVAIATVGVQMYYQSTPTPKLATIRA